MAGTIRTSLVIMVLSCWASSSLAITPEQKEKVRQLVKEGGELTQQGRLDAARDRLTEALTLARVPAIALYVGRAHEALRELSKAAQMYRMAIEMPLDEALWDNDPGKTEFQRRAREDARTALGQLLERNPTIKVQLVGSTGQASSVSLDGAVWDNGMLAHEQPVAAGSHVIAITHGSKRLSQTVNLDRADHKTVTFDLTPNSEAKATGTSKLPEPTAPTVRPSAPPAAKSDPVAQNTATASHSPNYLAWSALAVGAAGLGLGTIAAIITNGKRTTLINEGCTSDGVCPPNSQVTASDISSHNTWRTTSVVGFVIGGLGAATAATLWLTGSNGQSTPQVGVFAAPGTVGVLGAF